MSSRIDLQSGPLSLLAALTRTPRLILSDKGRMSVYSKDAAPNVGTPPLRSRPRLLDVSTWRNEPPSGARLPPGQRPSAGVERATLGAS